MSSTDRVRPFLIVRGRVGCLLLHGLTGTPYELRDLGDALAAAGVTVSCPLLPGHGTDPLDLDATRWPDWEAAAEAALKDLAGRTDRQFLCGISMGASLAIRLASRHEVAGLIALSPAIKLRSRLAPLLPLISRVKRFKKKTSDIKDPVALARHPSYKMQSLAAANSLRELLELLPGDFSALRMPLLVMVAAEDHVIELSGARRLYAEAPATDKRFVVLEDSYHVITVDREAERVRREVVEFVREIAGI
ncbi:MAG: alpha/beta fold hydrolase [Deltaproteobacteria bacterium]|nr:alpha/beta fold hydrolase [Deltaproteobacteria bacterium]